ncbi:MAG: hypothetical protein ACRDH2_12610, partial [Anaerolineales bacterium]
MRLIHRHLRALALQSTSPPLSFSLSLCFLTLHLLALLAVCRVAHWPLWLAPLLLVIFCLPQLLLRRRWIESLAPLFGAYGLAGLRLFIVYVLRQEASPVLSYGWAVALSALWMGLIWLRMLRRLRHAWLALGLSAAAFLVYLLWLNRPAGVTGSDPFAYVQMGLDLALRGT